MEQTVIKKEPEELVDDFHGDISMNYDHETASTSGIAIKQEIKEELEEEEIFFDEGSKIKDESEDFSCNIKEEDRDEDGMKIEVDFHGVQSDDLSGKGKLFECDVCPKKYQTKMGLFNHIKYIHKKHELEKFKCCSCDFVSVRKSTFKIHLKIHDTKNYLRCHFCDYMSAGLQTLNSHILSKHKLENKKQNKITSKIHECSKCSYSSVIKSHYNNHIKICLKLENVEWFKCEICNYKTIHKYHLTTHQKIHNKLKDLKCMFCTFQCNVKRDLDNHILTKHPHLLNESNQSLITAKVHSCQHCSYKTTNTMHLKKHVNHNH